MFAECFIEYFELPAVGVLELVDEDCFVLLA